MKRLPQRILLLFLSIFLCILIPVSLIANTLHGTLLKPYSTGDYFAESGLSASFAVLIPEMLGAQQENDETEIQEESSKQFRLSLKKAVEEVITAEWMNDKINVLQTELWDFVLGKTERIEPIAMPELRDAILHQLNDLTQMDAAKDQLEQFDPAEDQLVQFMDELENKIPSELDVEEVYKMDEKRLLKLRNGYEMFRSGYLSIVSITVFVLLLVMVAAFYPTTILRWVGYPLGVIGLALFVLFRWLQGFAFDERLQPVSFPEVYAPLKENFLQLIRLLQTQITEHMLLGAAILLVSGITLVIVSHLPYMKNVHNAMYRSLAHNSKVAVVRWLAGLIILAGIGWQVHRIYKLYILTSI